MSASSGSNCAAPDGRPSCIPTISTDSPLHGIALRASGSAGQAEARLRRHDGEYRWFLLRVNPLRDENGTIVKWYGVNTDIEDLKRAEAELQRRAALLHQGEAVSETGSFLWRVETATN